MLKNEKDVDIIMIKGLKYFSIYFKLNKTTNEIKNNQTSKTKKQTQNSNKESNKIKI